MITLLLVFEFEFYWGSVLADVHLISVIDFYNKMSTEFSAVFVAVRVRPFVAREDLGTCTIHVPDDHTIVVTDANSMMSNSLLPGSNSSLSGVGMGQGTTPARHAFTFDKIFWSVPTGTLPLQTLASSTNVEAPRTLSNRQASLRQNSALGSPSSVKGGPIPLPNPELGSPRWSPLASQAGLTNKQMPCYAPVPTYDDQLGVYTFLGPRLYEAAIAGYNACLLAYGQTGSGKSYSMLGPPDFHAHSKDFSSNSINLSGDVGIIPRLITDVFRLMREEREKDETVSFTMELSFLEIYCEKVRDLLVCSRESASSTRDDTTATSLRVRQHPKRGPYVEGLSHIRVRSTEGAIKQIMMGLKDRVTAETNMNEHSSRSHAIVQLNITRIAVTTEDSAIVTRSRTSKLNLVDLAGSERVQQSGVTGDRFEEARNINLSLSTLGRVIQQLGEKQTGRNVIPAYRDSALTWLLSDSLGGNSKTLLLATVAPSGCCYGQTLNALRFAGIAQKVINVASVNDEDSQSQKIIAELRQKIVQLTLQLERGQSAEVYRAERAALRKDVENLTAENNTLRAARVALPASVDCLRERVDRMLTDNGELCSEPLHTQERYLVSTTCLTQELALRRDEVRKLQELCSTKDTEMAACSARYRELHQRSIEAAKRGTTKSSKPLLRSKATNTPAPAVTPQAPMDLNLPKLLQQQQKQLLRKKELLRKATKDLKVLQAQVEDARESAKVTTSELDDYRARYKETKQQLHQMHSRLRDTVGALEAMQCELRAFKVGQGHQQTPPTSSLVEGPSVTSASEEPPADARQSYLSEKQENIELRLRSSQLETERNLLQQWATERLLDTAVLEQLLLEEAESSARYTMHMRYHRTVSEAQHHFIRMLVLPAQRPGSSRVVRLSPEKLVSPPTPLPSLLALAPSPAAKGTPMAVPSATDSPFILEGLPYQAVPPLHNSWEVMGAYEIVQREAHERSTIEQEHLSTMTRCLSQRDHLRGDAYAVISGHLPLVQDQLTAAHEEWSEHKRHTRELSEQITNLLTADATKIKDTLQHLLTVELHATQEGDAHQLRSVQHAFRNLWKHAAETQAMEQAVAAEMIQRERRAVQQDRAKLEAERVALHAEMDTVRADCDARMAQQLSTIHSLREALKEESELAERSREAARRAEATAQSSTVAMVSIIDTHQELLDFQQATEEKLERATRELQALTSTHAMLERQLGELHRREPELYVLLQRGASEDSTAWLEKVRTEKVKMEKQKADAHQLNRELIDHVRARSARLRDVEMQLDELVDLSTPTPRTLTSPNSSMHQPAMRAQHSVLSTEASSLDIGEDGLPRSPHTSWPPSDGA